MFRVLKETRTRTLSCQNKKKTACLAGFKQKQPGRALSVRQNMICFIGGPKPTGAIAMSENGLPVYRAQTPDDDVPLIRINRCLFGGLEQARVGALILSEYIRPSSLAGPQTNGGEGSVRKMAYLLGGLKHPRWRRLSVIKMECLVGGLI